VRLQAVQEGKDRLQKLVWQLDRLQPNVVGLERQLNDEIARIQHHLDTADQTGDKAQAAIDTYKVSPFYSDVLSTNRGASSNNRTCVKINLSKLVFYKPTMSVELSRNLPTKIFNCFFCKCNCIAKL